MAELSNIEHELVALGAAIASNCVPCTEFHIAEARKFGLKDSQIIEAVQLADKVRQVPARKVFRIAMGLLNGTEAASAVTGDSAQPVSSVNEEEHPCCR
jgi:AhpD family alkylhydroperoxidase